MKAKDLESLNSYVKKLKEALKGPKPCIFVLVEHKFNGASQKIILMGPSLIALKNEFSPVMSNWDPLDQGQYEKPTFKSQKSMLKSSHFSDLKVSSSDLVIAKATITNKSRFGNKQVYAKQNEDLGDTKVEDILNFTEEAELILSKIDKNALSDRGLRAWNNTNEIISMLKECIEKKNTTGSLTLMDKVKGGINAINEDLPKADELANDLNLLKGQIEQVPLKSYKTKTTLLFEEAKALHANAKYNEVTPKIQQINDVLMVVPQMLKVDTTIRKIEPKLKMQLRIPGNQQIEIFKQAIGIVGAIKVFIDECKSEAVASNFLGLEKFFKSNGISLETGDMIGGLSAAMGESIVADKTSLHKAYQNQKKLFTVEVTQCLKKSVESNKVGATQFFKQLAEFIKGAKGDLGASLKAIEEATERNAKVKQEVNGCLETVGQRIESMKDILASINPEAKDMELPQTRKYLHVLMHIKSTLPK